VSLLVGLLKNILGILGYYLGLKGFSIAHFSEFETSQTFGHLLNNRTEDSCHNKCSPTGCTHLSHMLGGFTRCTENSGIFDGIIQILGAFVTSLWRAENPLKKIAS
jgi:hypothetical protein